MENKTLEYRISDLMIEYGPDGHCDGADKIAEECKQVAIKFNKHLQHNWINIWGGNNYVPRYSILAKKEHHISIEEVFAKFIEEEYERKEIH